jgi:inhibitor of cysteine peptidase
VRRALIAAACVLVSLVTVVGCGPADNTPVIPPTEEMEGTVTATSAGQDGSALVLREADDGRTIEIASGGTLEIQLSGNPTTGYEWEVVTLDDSVIRQTGRPSFRPSSSAIGSGGTVTLRFEAVAPGQTELELAYGPSYNPDRPPDDTFSVTVVVN